MKWADIKHIPWRVKLLVTGHAVWVNVEDGTETHVKEGWRMRWTIAGIHSYKWWWVKRWGKLDCGCSRNPLTRRFISYRVGCPQNHGYINQLDYYRQEGES